MPTEVDIPDFGIVEFPDDLSEEDVSNEIRKLTGPNISNIVSQQPLEIPYQPGFPSGIMPPTTETEPQSFIQEALQDRGEGVLSAAGITPESVPSGTGLIGTGAELFGRMIGKTPEESKVLGEIVKDKVPNYLSIVPTVASSVAKTGLGIGEYLSSPQGVTELVLSMTPARLLVLGKWAGDMAKGAGQEAGALSTLVNKENKTPEDWQEISDRTVNTLAMTFGAGGAAKGGFKPIRNLAEPKTMRAVRELDEMLRTVEPSSFTAPRVPQRQLGIPPAALSAEPFLQPGVPELASAALREAQGPRIEVPGELSALEALRREVDPPQITPVERRLAERTPERGETMVTPTLTGAQVQPRVLRSASDVLLERSMEQRTAEAPTAERTQNAIQPESRPIPRDVQQPEVAQKGAEQVPTAEGSAKAAEARVTETVESVSAVNPGEFFSQSEKWSKEAMSPEGGVNPQFRAELVALRNPDVAAWQQALSKASAEFAEIRDRAKADPNLMSNREFQREFSGAAQKSQFFSEGLAVLEGRKAADPRTLEMFNREAEAERAKAAEGRPPVREMRPIEPGRGEEINAPSVEDVRAQRALEGRQSEAAPQPVKILSRARELFKTKNKTSVDSKVQALADEFHEKLLKSSPKTEKDVESSEYLNDMSAKYPDPQAAVNMLRAVISPKSSSWDVTGFARRLLGRGQVDYYVKAGKDLLDAQQKELARNQAEFEAALKETPAAPDLISKLESLKFPETGEGRLYSLPHPDAIKAIGKTAWNSAVDAAIAAVKAGKSISEAVEAGIAYLKKNVKAFDEKQVRANMEHVTRAETRPAVPSTEGESVKMRKSAERATTSPMVPEPVQERIANAPESFYRQQSMKRVEEVVSAMDEGQLAAIPRDSNLYTASRLEQAKRLFDRGENDAGYRVFEELEREGTQMGQLINQFKLLKGTRPENVVRVINEQLKKSGKDVLNERQSKEALEKASKSKQKDADLDKATEAWSKEPTEKNAEAAEKALLEANDAGVELQRFVSRFTPRSTASVIKSVLQGNLLTPISEVANIVGNMSFLPFRAADRGVATAFDILDSYLKRTPREITVQPVAGAVEALRGFGRGVKKVPDVFLRGTGDVIKGETRAGLHPVEAWIEQFSKNPERPTVGGKLALGDRVNLAIEGTFGIPAELMLRGLGAGDVAFKESALARATATQLKLANVPKEKWAFAQKFPELFLNEKAMENIRADTMAAVFQRQSKTLNVVTNWIRSRGEWFDLAVATIAPYKLTPWNIVGEILSYNPLIAFGRSLYDFKNGNRRSAKINAGKYVVGSMLTGAAWWLYSKGLVTPSLDERDEQQKARILAGEVMPPNHVNISGLKRALSGGDPGFKAGDETVDIFRAGGLAGSIIYMTANIGRDFERRPEVADSEVWTSIMRQSTLEQARFGLNQSFLSGVEGFLTAVKDGNADSFVNRWANTVTSIPLPNSLSTLSRATRKYKPEFREDEFKKQMENLFRSKLGFAGMDDYLPLKRGLWGEPLKETPEGRNSLIYHFFDISKNRQVTGDPVPLELFRLWRKTGDTRVIPSIPEKVMTIQRKSYPLTTAQQSRYAELVGGARRSIVDKLVVNPKFHEASDEVKIQVLDQVYRAGLERGKMQFIAESKDDLKAKPERAGFKP